MEFPIVCKLCKKSFKRKKNYMRHIKNHKNKPFFCRFCLVKICCRQHFILHMQRHTASQAYVCQFCQLNFSDLARLKQHVPYHTGLVPITCDFCEQEFQTKLASSVEDFLPLNGKGLMKVMFYSPLIFKSEEELYLHQEVRHNIINQESSKELGNRQEFKCCRCDIYFDNGVDLQAHFEDNPLVNFDGTCGCGMFQLLRLSVGRLNMFHLRMKERQLDGVLIEFLKKMSDDEIESDLASLAVNDLIKRFCKAMLIRPLAVADDLLNGPINRLVFDMIFILKEICTEER